MTDIFEIKDVNAELRIGDRVFKFADPKYQEHISIQREYTKLMKEREAMDMGQYFEKQHELDRRSIRSYLPEMTDKDLDDLGFNKTNALLTKLIELAETKFGAIVQRVDLEKK